MKAWAILRPNGEFSSFRLFTGQREAKEYAKFYALPGSTVIAVQPLPAGKEDLPEIGLLIGCAKCKHESRTGGNDYLLCNDCHLMWDYRREKPADAIVRMLAALAVGPSPPEKERP